MRYYVADSYKNYKYNAENAFEKEGKLYVSATCNCDRCMNGTYYWGAVVNGAPQYAGTCFKCNGTGYISKDIRLYTEAEKASMDKAKIKKHENRIKEQNERNLRKKTKFFETHGFSENGETYCIFGEKTFFYKDKLKEAGGKYCTPLGWHFAAEPVDLPEELHTIKINFDNYYVWNDGGAYAMSDAADRLKIEQEKLFPTVLKGEYVGEIGERLRDIAVTVVSTRTYESMYGEGVVYCFEDNDGNYFTWFASRDYGYKVDDVCLLTGTVKKHENFRGKRVTYVNRCKFAEVE